MNPRRWLQRHSLKLLAIRDTPEAIAGGVAIGVFFGFAPLFGLKTVLTILFAWLTQSNIIAAILAVTAHDILLPLMPAIYIWEYRFGFWVLSEPHRFPAFIPRLHRDIHSSWRTWLPVLLGVGKPLLVGGTLLASPIALVCYFLTRKFVGRHQCKRDARKTHAPAPEVEDNPS